jgi:hypothetical protein
MSYFEIAHHGRHVIEIHRLELTKDTTMYVYKN